MEEEWRFHLEARADALVAQGIPRDEAVRRARVEFGDPLRWKAAARPSFRSRLVVGHQRKSPAPRRRPLRCTGRSFTDALEQLLKETDLG